MWQDISFYLSDGRRINSTVPAFSKPKESVKVVHVTVSEPYEYVGKPINYHGEPLCSKD